MTKRIPNWTGINLRVCIRKNKSVIKQVFIIICFSINNYKMYLKYVLLSINDLIFVIELRKRKEFKENRFKK